MIKMLKLIFKSVRYRYLESSNISTNLYVINELTQNTNRKRIKVLLKLIVFKRYKSYKI